MEHINRYIAEQLNKLGVKNESKYYWHNYSLTAYGWSEWTFGDKDDEDYKWLLTDESYEDELSNSCDHSSDAPKEAIELRAYSTQEMLDIMPHSITSSKPDGLHYYELQIHANEEYYMVGYYDNNNNCWMEHNDSEYLVDAVGMELVELLELGMINLY